MSRALVASALLVSLTACNDSATPPSAVAQACIAEQVGELRAPQSMNLANCSPEDAACRDGCLAGDAALCLARGYAFEAEPSRRSEAAPLYLRACSLGLAIGCTNYAARIWGTDHTEEQLACARRTFDKACAAGEHYACGMVGRIMHDQAKSPSDFAECRQYLERGCEEVGGFSCRVLAKQLEAGTLGAYEPSRIATLLARACEGGDADGCGQPATAAETFH